MGEYYHVQEGLGALLKAHATGIPMDLNTTAQRIDWSGMTIVVEMLRAETRIKKIVVCMLPSVINARRLRFSIELPSPTANALSCSRLGAFEKFDFLLDKSIDDFDQGYSDVIHPNISGREIFSLQIHEFGAPLLIGLVGDSVGRELEHAGESSMHEARIEFLIHAFGIDIREQIQHTDFMHWSSQH